MNIYAISDLHLSYGSNKPMEIFGENWNNHADRIKENWECLVKESDYVLIPGDISWGISLKEANYDLAFIDSLPGKKIISKGNHDYWWSTIKKFTEHCEKEGYRTLNLLHNNAYKAGKYAICGTRGWISPDEEGFTQEDKKIFDRELQRLKLSLIEGSKTGCEIIAMLHFPPFDTRHRPNEFSELLREYGVKSCIYGHIHGKANEAWKNEVIDGIDYHLISCDIISFTPIKLR
jgi:predicted phosphohydrolase